MDCVHRDVDTANKKAATCTEAGYTGDEVCADCGMVVRYGTAIESLGEHVYGEGVVTAKIEDQYANMKTVLEDKMYVVERACEAYRKVGVEPVSVAIRGGTDGARLSFMGVPCPNLGTGGGNYHGEYEYISVEKMEKSVEIIINIVKGTVKRFAK